MTKKECFVCGQETTRPIAASLEHFRLVEWGQWHFWRGNVRMFGFWQGLAASICLSFPIINTLWHWKYRRHRLALPDEVESNAAAQARSSAQRENVTLEPLVGPDLKCMYCDSRDGHWEIVRTNVPTFGGEEIWFCCHRCRDANEPCETFHPLPDSWKTPNAPAQAQAAKRPVALEPVVGPDGDTNV